jgi:EpsI family protein
MPSEPASQQPAGPRVAWLAALVCAEGGIALFQYFGNGNHGYIATDSLFWWWVYQWLNPASELGHAWLILGLSGWLLWRNLKNADRGLRSADSGAAAADGPAGGALSDRGVPGSSIPQSAIRNPQLGVPYLELPAIAAMLGGLALHAVGYVGQQARLSILALLLFTWGVLRLGGGRRWGRAAAFPLAFLVFAMPVDVLDSVGFWLRLWVVSAGAGIAHLAGVGVVRSGTQLFAPDGSYNYDVAAACSGVRSLMALSALSLLIGYLQFRSWRRRGLLLLLCFPLVYLGNVARIVAIVLAAQAGGPAWGDRVHAAMGYAVFVIVLGGVLGAAALLNRFFPDGEPPRAQPPPREDGVSSSRWWVLGCAAAVVALAIGEMALLRRSALLPPRGDAGIVLTNGGQPAELPVFLGRQWVGFPAPVSAVERELLPPDTGYSRIEYASTRDPHRVFLSIVLSGRDRTSIHRPELCLLGQGWTISGRGSHVFAYPGGQGAGFEATVLQAGSRSAGVPGGRASAPQLVVYWFVGGDRVVATHWQRLAIDAWNRIARGRADRWAYVLMQTDASDGEAAALARMQAVPDATLPGFQKPVQ